MLEGSLLDTEQGELPVLLLLLLFLGLIAVVVV
jgi:F0F1-type ATP synthase assembly protein I